MNRKRKKRIVINVNCVNRPKVGYCYGQIAYKVQYLHGTLDAVE